MKKLSIAIVVYIFINKCFYRKFLNQKKSNLYGSTLIGQGGKTVWVKIKEWEEKNEEKTIYFINDILYDAVWSC